jgi:hypothetical protein
MASVLGKNGLWIGLAVLVVGVGLALLFRERAFIPESTDFYAIRAIPYDRQTMNCLHKAIRYADILEERGWTRWIVVGHIASAGCFFFHSRGSGNDHAWVVVLDKDGVRRLCDPTTGRYEASGFRERSYKLYKARTYYESVLDIRP